MASNNSDYNGCGCIILIVVVIGFFITKCNEPEAESVPAESSQTTAYQYAQVNDTQFDEIEEVLSEEDKQYLHNSLSTGATPYKEFYGKNYQCPYAQCSGIKITAPQESDIVVIIKRNNKDGKVIQHGYIRAGDTCQFDIPDGTYQTFFYYGKGWNPNKEMTGGIRGGFVKNEIFSKDNPQNIYSGVLTYVLQLQRDGNFQTKSSNRNEMF